MNERFSLYLKNIGIINERFSSPIMRKDDKSSNQSFTDSSFDLLMNYFNNLNDEQKKYMSSCIPSKFIIISEKNKQNKLKSAFIQLILRKKLILLKYFYIWKLNITLIENKIKLNFENYVDNVALYNLNNIDCNLDADNINYTKTEEEEMKNKIDYNKKKEPKINIKNKTTNNSMNESTSNITKNNNKNEIKLYNHHNKNKNKLIKRNKTQININLYKKQNDINLYKKYNNYIKQKRTRNNNNNNNKFNKSHLMTSLEEKEMIELKECFFRPKINKPKNLFRKINSFKKNNNLSLTNKTDQKDFQSRFEKLYRDNEKYKLSKQLKSIKLENIASTKITFIPEIKKKNKKIESEENFQKRQEKFLLKKHKHSAEIRDRIDSTYDSVCSFNPKITNYELCSTINKEKYDKKPAFLRLYQDSKKRHNSQIQLEVDQMNKIIDLSNIINPEKNFEFDTINKLYENKEKNIIINKTKKKVEEEEGTTFKPYILDNFYSRNVNGTFYERNQKFINDRENFYEEENKKQQDSAKKNINKKEYTKQERKKIISNIIDRLYNDSIYLKRQRPNKNNDLRNVKSFL